MGKQVLSRNHGVPVNRLVQRDSGLRREKHSSETEHPITWFLASAQGSVTKTGLSWDWKV